MFRTRLLLGRMGMYDQYQDWRLDVDNMNYEELLALEDRIGYVSTGLREDEIVRGLRVGKHQAFERKHFSTETERRCSICQEDFEASEEVGRLSCGHGYHVHCIKQWLSRKNACPLCKIPVSKPWDRRSSTHSLYFLVEYTCIHIVSEGCLFLCVVVLVHAPLLLCIYTLLL